jgi:hypothetical protein
MHAVEEQKYFDPPFIFTFVIFEWACGHRTANTGAQEICISYMEFQSLYYI